MTLCTIVFFCVWIRFIHIYICTQCMRVTNVSQTENCLRQSENEQANKMNASVDDRKRWMTHEYTHSYIHTAFAHVVCDWESHHMRRTFSAACSLCDAAFCLTSGQWHVQYWNQCNQFEMRYAWTQIIVCRIDRIPIDFDYNGLRATWKYLHIKDFLLLLLLVIFRFSLFFQVHFRNTHCLLCVFDHIYRRISRALYKYIYIRLSMCAIADAYHEFSLLNY